MAQGRGAGTPRLQDPAVRGGSGEGFEHEDEGEHEHDGAGTRGRDAPPTGPAVRGGSGEGVRARGRFRAGAAMGRRRQTVSVGLLGGGGVE